MLDSLGHGREAERVAEPEDRVDERLVRILAHELVDERLRDLQRLDRELCETAQRRVARAEVVDRQPDAEVTQPLHRDERAVAPLDDARLGHLDHDPARLDAVAP